MNTTDAPTSWEIWDTYYSSGSTAILQDVWITIIAFFIQLLYLGTLVWRDLVQTRFLMSTKTIFTSVNLVLFLMILSYGGSVTVNLLPRSYPAFSVYVASDLTANALFYMFEIFVFVYTLNRGLPVIEVVIPRSRPYLHPIIAIYSLLLLSQFITIVLSWYPDIYINILDLYFYLNIANYAVVISFDLFVTGVYGYYLKTVEGSDLNVRRLVLISKFGCGSMICIQILLISTIYYSQLQLNDFPAVSIQVWILLVHLQYLIPLVYIFLQLWMKQTLQNEQLLEIERRIQSIESARQMSDHSFNIKTHGASAISQKPDRSTGRG
ncbi:hypothetical protein HDU79_002740 [Rhizoclosmatium sp. JEL0117]|nr:hypothetical protein HDU79_002740 [Rhizoclosmatium sp. JEL0117]